MVNKKLPRKQVPVGSFKRCACGHVALIHGDQGAGHCEGLLTCFDRMGSADYFPSLEPCDCERFEGVSHG